MSEPADFAPEEAALPGMEPAKPGESSMRAAARRTIASLQGAGYLDERHAVLCEQMLQLADVVDAGRRQGKASAAAMAAQALIATYEHMIPESNGGEGGDAWDELVADMRRSAAAPRDSS